MPSRCESNIYSGINYEVVSLEPNLKVELSKMTIEHLSQATSNSTPTMLNILQWFATCATLPGLVSLPQLPLLIYRICHGDCVGTMCVVCGCLLGSYYRGCPLGWRYLGGCFVWWLLLGITKTFSFTQRMFYRHENLSRIWRLLARLLYIWANCVTHFMFIRGYGWSNTLKETLFQLYLCWNVVSMWDTRILN